MCDSMCVSVCVHNVSPACSVLSAPHSFGSVSALHLRIVFLFLFYCLVFSLYLYIILLALSRRWLCNRWISLENRPLRHLLSREKLKDCKSPHNYCINNVCVSSECKWNVQNIIVVSCPRCCRSDGRRDSVSLFCLSMRLTAFEESTASPYRTSEHAATVGCPFISSSVYVFIKDLVFVWDGKL